MVYHRAAVMRDKNSALGGNSIQQLWVGNSVQSRRLSRHEINGWLPETYGLHDSEPEVVTGLKAEAQPRKSPLPGLGLGALYLGPQRRVGMFQGNCVPFEFALAVRKVPVDLGLVIQVECNRAVDL